MQENSAERIRECFWKRLEGLLTERGLKKEKEQYDYLGVSKRTLENWKGGAALPRHLEMLRIANLLGCSVDYLIDETVTVKTASSDIQAAVKTTGLSEEAINILHTCERCGTKDILKTINAIIVSDIALHEMKPGNILKNSPPVKNGFTATISGDGTVIQATGIIGSLMRHLEISSDYERECEKLKALTKERYTAYELEEHFNQSGETYRKRELLENSCYKMMVACTTATEMKTEYHKTLFEAYKEGGEDRGKHQT